MCPLLVFRLLPPSIFFSLHPFANIGSAVLELHAIRFTTREKAHYVPTDETHVLQVYNDVAVIRLEFEKPPQLGDRRCWLLLMNVECKLLAMGCGFTMAISQALFPEVLFANFCTSSRRVRRADLHRQYFRQACPCVSLYSH